MCIRKTRLSLDYLLTQSFSICDDDDKKYIEKLCVNGKY